jgi:hypothetical protein
MKSRTPYRPSNATEGFEFEERFCRHCIRESMTAYRGESDNHCPHLVKGACRTDHNGKWFLVDGHPVCTAFKDRREYYRERRERINKKQLLLFA